MNLADIPGYEYYGKLSGRIAKHGPEQFTRFLADLQVWGTPEQVTEQMIEHQRMLDSAGVRAADEDAAVTLSADVETFQQIMSGDLNPTTAFMTGRLSVDGDMGQAMALGSVLG